MIYGKLSIVGILTDIGNRPPQTWVDGSTDVPLAAMPSDKGPYTYDAVNQLAVFSQSGKDEVDKTTAKTILDSDRVQKALAVVIAAEFKRRRQWDMGMQTAVASASGATPAAVWNDFKARVAALPAAPDIEVSDVVAAVKAAIDAAT